MSEIIDFEDEESNMGSVNHSLTAGRITGLLFNDERFEVMPELSLDTSQIDLKRFNLKSKDELVPDICVYTGAAPAPDEDVDDDLLKVSQMPDLAIEVLSPRQSIGELIRKIKAYFSLGVKSCWLAIPSIEAIDVYSQPNQHKTYDMGDTEVIDEVMDIRLPIHKVFGKRSHLQNTA
jgi:Uma2 family endonuclease